MLSPSFVCSRLPANNFVRSQILARASGAICRTLYPVSARPRSIRLTKENQAAYFCRSAILSFSFHVGVGLWSDRRKLIRILAAPALQVRNHDRGPLLSMTLVAPLPFRNQSLEDDDNHRLGYYDSLRQISRVRPREILVPGYLCIP
jgi:hypothetical protein